ncbi:hypothetical protein L226DRAFT_15561 [Lentinus tigrinus ALCF2SS1-7]|uniref:uncharacterized protein n=1 Tax=Lentinus tigrinus ALCF2SS1-7 TaxID=1328758 RepID=UPI001165D2CF|nr:hypothetical protein L226DRAFT_15561 [Lentinus tigrinus ALCF2SS1-7]
MRRPPGAETPLSCAQLLTYASICTPGLARRPLFLAIRVNGLAAGTVTTRTCQTMSVHPPLKVCIHGTNTTLAQ